MIVTIEIVSNPLGLPTTRVEVVGENSRPEDVVYATKQAEACAEKLLRARRATREEK